MQNNHSANRALSAKTIEYNKMWNITLIMAGMLLLIGCNSKCTTSTPDPPGSAQLRMGEGSATADGLSVTNGNVVLTDGRPGIAFAFATIPGQTKRFTYFLVFNHDFPDGGVATQSGGDGLTATASHTIKSFGNDCKVEYRVELIANTKTVKTDSTVIADSTYDASEGKLFLLNMKTTPPTVTQFNLELPSDIPNFEKPDAATKFGEDTLSQLRKSDKRVDAFCLQIEQDDK